MSVRAQVWSGLRGLPRNIWALSLTSFLRDTASEMLVHLTPLYLANVLGARTGVIGLIEGIAETTASLTKVASGWLSDRAARRKPLTVFGYAVAAASVPLLAVSTTAVGVAAARWLDRLGKGLRTAPRDALIADSVAADRRGASFGLHRAADSFGALLGTLGALVLVWRMQAGADFLAANTFHVLVLAALVPSVLAVAVVAFGVREAAHPRSATAGMPSVRPSPRFLRLLVVMLIFTLGNSADAFLVLRAQSAGASVVQVLGLVALFNLVYAAGAAPLGALSDRHDRKAIMIAGWLVYAAVYLGFARVASGLVLAALFAAYGLYYALTEGIAKALVADIVTAESRGTSYGLYNASVGLLALPASVLAGVLWQGAGSWPGFGPAAPFVVGAGLAVVAAVLLWAWVR